jgi:hypothetical protein
MERFFSAAARLWRADPFSVLASGQALCIDAPELDLEAAAVCMIRGNGDDPPALWWTENIEDCLSVVDSFSGPGAPGTRLQEPVRLLSYEQGSEIPEEIRRDITREGLEVADASSYPMLVVLGEDGEASTPDLEDLLLTALCLEALAELFEQRRDDLASYDPVVHEMSMSLLGRTVEVVVTSPHPELEIRPEQDGDGDPLEGFYDADEDPHAERWLKLDESEQQQAIMAYHDAAQPHPRPPSRRLHALMHAVVETQIASNTPPEARQALERLTSQGLSRHDAIHAIATPMAEFIFEASQGKRYDPEAHRKALDDLDVDSYGTMVEHGLCIPVK